MKVITVKGSWRQMGQSQGEELRQEIRAHLNMKSPKSDEWRNVYGKFLKNLPVFLDVLKQHLPDVLEELEGLAEGAGLKSQEIFWLNLRYPALFDLSQHCTNIAASNGPDGPLLGKNNDGNHPSEKIAPALVVSYPQTGLPTIRFTLAGWLSTLDVINAEGLSIGHSSVGSAFQQSVYHFPIRLWGYEGLKKCRDTAEFATWMSSTPMRGKGYTILCIDREGQTCSLEAPCPLIQIRQPASGQTVMNCVNCFQLPTLAKTDNRSAEGRANAWARAKFIEEMFSQNEPINIEKMKQLLRYHGRPSLCRHGGKDMSYTEFSYIAVPAKAKVLFFDGNPCSGEYSQLCI